MTQSTFYQTGLRLIETVQLAEDQRLSLVGSGAATFLTQEAAILADGIPFDTFDEQTYMTAEGQSRAFFSQALNSFGGEIASCLLEFAKVIAPSGAGVSQTQATSILPLVYQYMAIPQQASAFSIPHTSVAGCAQTTLLVNSRNLTRGTPTYGSSNVGTGILYRLNTDAYGFPLEGGYAETLNMTCTADAQTGTITGQEQFSVIGQPFRDALTWFASGYGSGLQALGASGLVGVTADTTQSLIQNSSFSQSTGSGGTFVLTGWTQTSGSQSSMTLDTVNFYRAAQVEGSTPAALKLTGSVTITQKISSNAGALALTAFLNQIAWNGSINTWSGSFTVAIGSKSWSVSSGASGWQTLRPTIDKNLWTQNFNQANLAVTLTITVSSGALLLDDFCWAPMTNLGASLYWLIGGQTAFLVNDTIQAVDSEPSPPSKVQNWIRLMYPGYYLSSAVLPTPPNTAATLAQGSAGASVTAGAHVGYVTFLTSTAESGVGTATAIFVSDGAHHISWSSIPTGPGGTIARGLYRTKAVATGNPYTATPYLVGYISDNSTTTFDDSVADGSLTKQPASIADPVN